MNVIFHTGLSNATNVSKFSELHENSALRSYAIGSDGEIPERKENNDKLERDVLVFGMNQITEQQM